MLAPLLALFLAAPGAAVTVILDAPAGWERSESDGEVDFTPPDVPAGLFYQLQVLPSQAAADLPAWFGRAWSELKGSASDVRETPVQAMRSADYQAMIAAGSMAVARDRFLYLALVAVWREGRVQPLLVVTDDNRLYAAHQAEVQSLLTSLRFRPRSEWPAPAPPGSRRPHPYRPPSPVARAPAPVVAPRARDAGDLVTPSFTWAPIPRPKGDAGLSGIYGAFLAVQNWSHTWVEPRWIWFAFLPDGRATRVLPAEGLHSFSFDYWHEMNPMFYGHYGFSGGKGAIEWDGGGGTMTLERTREGLAINGNGPFKRFDPCDGLVLDGTYRRSDWKTLDLDLYRNAHITFHGDGTFEDDSMLDLSGGMWWRPGKEDLMEKPIAGRGTYSIEDYSLTLLYQDGRKRRINFALPPDRRPGDVSTFMVNGWKWVRVP